MGTRGIGRGKRNHQTTKMRIWRFAATKEKKQDTGLKPRRYRVTTRAKARSMLRHYKRPPQRSPNRWSRAAGGWGVVAGEEAGDGGGVDDVAQHGAEEGFGGGGGAWGEGGEV